MGDKNIGPPLIVYCVSPTLYLTRPEVLSLTHDDEAMLRELGATDGMLSELQRLAEDGRTRFRLDFHLKVVVDETQSSQTHVHADARKRLTS